MYLSRLILDDYRSWPHCLVDLTPGVNVLVGHNGLGKTNIMEAVEFLSTGGSHRVRLSQPLVRQGAKAATIRAKLVQGDRETQYTVTIPGRGANRAKINNGPSLYMRDIVGQVKTVVFAPEDQLLISMDPGHRRRFLDDAGVQLIRPYYDLLQRYAHVAKQRVALLKRISQARFGSSPFGGLDDLDASYASLEVWTGQLINLGLALTQERADICQRLSPIFNRTYRHLAGDGQEAQLRYLPSFEEFLEIDPAGDQEVVFDRISQHFQRLFEGELAQGRNLIGPHRDDVEFVLNGFPARDYASNGELWTLSLALKMSLFQLLLRVEQKGEEGEGGEPILILDDVFSQLDNSRREKIVDFASKQGQVLITAASPDDLPRSFIQNQALPVQIIDVEAVARKAQEDFFHA
ncbi:DNA replication/repair protein RecF [Parascardovia denticolens]